LSILAFLALTLLESKTDYRLTPSLDWRLSFFFAAWTSSYLTTANLYTALTFYFVFALFHSATPLVLHRLRKIHIPGGVRHFPLVAPAGVDADFSDYELSIVVWPFVLIVDILAFGLALATGRLLPIFAMLLLTLIAMGGWLLRIPRSSLACDSAFHPWRLCDFSF